jgi:hypothetical protein
MPGMEGPPGTGNDPWLIGGSLPTITAPPRRPDASGRPENRSWPRTMPWPDAPTAVSMPVSFRSPIPAPPRPDDPAEPLRDSVRGSYQRGALTLLGFMLGGFLVGYATMAAHVPWGFTGSPSGMSSVSFTVAGIYLHNLLVVCVPILLFPLLFWAPGATAGLTGYSLGRLAAAWLGLHLPGSLLLAALVPHGIVEIPASLLGGLMAWRLGIAFWPEDVRRAAPAAAGHGGGPGGCAGRGPGGDRARRGRLHRGQDHARPGRPPGRVLSDRPLRRPRGPAVARRSPPGWAGAPRPGA